MVPRCCCRRRTTVVPAQNTCPSSRQRRVAPSGYFAAHTWHCQSQGSGTGGGGDFCALGGCGLGVERVLGLGVGGVEGGESRLPGRAGWERGDGGRAARWALKGDIVLLWRIGLHWYCSLAIRHVVGPGKALVIWCLVCSYVMFA